MSKYGARKVKLDGHVFDSKMEGDRYLVLKSRENSGQIAWLELQPVYHLHGVNGKTVCKYIPDFRYLDNTTGITVVEDVKGVKTRDFSIKRKLFEAEYQELTLIMKGDITSWPKSE